MLRTLDCHARLSHRAGKLQKCQLQLQLQLQMLLGLHPQQKAARRPCEQHGYVRSIKSRR